MNITRPSRNQTLKQVAIIFVLALACYFLHLVPFVFYTILCLFLVYLLYVLGLHLFAAKHLERKWPTRVLKTLERPIFFMGDFFETPSGKQVINAGIQLSVVGISLVILLLAILSILEAGFIAQDYQKLIIVYFLITLVAIGISSSGFESFINQKLFKAIQAPYSAQVATKLIYEAYMVLLITTTLHKLEDPAKLDFWNLVALPSFATFIAWERFKG